MPYRDDGRSRKKGAAQDRLAQLADEGNAQAARQATKVKRKVDAAYRAQQKERDAELRNAIVGNSGSFILTVLGLVVLGGAALWVGIHYGSDAHPMPVFLGIVALVASVALGILLRPVFARRLIAAEQRKLAALPYPIEGYFEVLRATPTDGHLTVEIRCLEGELDDKIARGLAGLLDAKVERCDDRVLVIRSAEITVAGGDDAPDSNLRFLSWERKLLDRVLQPLHDAHRVARVVITRR